LEDPIYSPEPEKKLVVADMITGWGVAEAVRHYYTLFGGSIQGKRVIVQGWGNVGSAAAYYLAKEGAKITGIIDRDGGLLRAEGFSFEEIKQLFLAKDGNKLRADYLIPFTDINRDIWASGAEVFIPCAASRLVQRDQVEALMANGLDVISCGANVPFADPEIFFGPIADFVDGKVSLIPDFIANCGMARVFAYLMGSHVEMSDKAIFTDTSDIIRKALENIRAQSPDKTGIAKRGFEIALKQLI
jgi:glutamate dehydrogenase/leucine dehydrogenase